MSMREAVLTRPIGPVRRGGGNRVARLRRLLRALRAPRNRGPVFYRLLLWSCRNCRPLDSHDPARQENLRKR